MTMQHDRPSSGSPVKRTPRGTPMKSDYPPMSIDALEEPVSATKAAKHEMGESGRTHDAATSPVEGIVDMIDEATMFDGRSSNADGSEHPSTADRETPLAGPLAPYWPESTPEADARRKRMAIENSPRDGGLYVRRGPYQGRLRVHMGTQTQTSEFMQVRELQEAVISARKELLLARNRLRDVEHSVLAEHANKLDSEVRAVETRAKERLEWMRQEYDEQAKLQRQADRTKMHDLQTEQAKKEEERFGREMADAKQEWDRHRRTLEQQIEEGREKLAHKDAEVLEQKQQVVHMRERMAVQRVEMEAANYEPQVRALKDANNTATEELARLRLEAKKYKEEATDKSSEATRVRARYMDKERELTVARGEVAQAQAAREEALARQADAHALEVTERDDEIERLEGRLAGVQEDYHRECQLADIISTRQKEALEKLAAENATLRKENDRLEERQRLAATHRSSSAEQGTVFLRAQSAQLVSGTVGTPLLGYDERVLHSSGSHYHQPPSTMGSIREGYPASAGYVPASAGPPGTAGSGPGGYPSSHSSQVFYNREGDASGQSQPASAGGYPPGTGGSGLGGYPPSHSPQVCSDREGVPSGHTLPGSAGHVPASSGAPASAGYVPASSGPPGTAGSGPGGLPPTHSPQVWSNLEGESSGQAKPASAGGYPAATYGLAYPPPSGGSASNNVYGQGTDAVSAPPGSVPGSSGGIQHADINMLSAAEQGAMYGMGAPGSRSGAGAAGAGAGADAAQQAALAEEELARQDEIAAARHAARQAARAQSQVPPLPGVYGVPAPGYEGAGYLPAPPPPPQQQQQQQQQLQQQPQRRQSFHHEPRRPAGPPPHGELVPGGHLSGQGIVTYQMQRTADQAASSSVMVGSKLATQGHVAPTGAGGWDRERMRTGDAVVGHSYGYVPPGSAEYAAMHEGEGAQVLRVPSPPHTPRHVKLSQVERGWNVAKAEPQPGAPSYLKVRDRIHDMQQMQHKIERAQAKLTVSVADILTPRTERRGGRLPDYGSRVAASGGRMAGGAQTERPSSYRRRVPLREREVLDDLAEPNFVNLMAPPDMELDWNSQSKGSAEPGSSRGRAPGSGGSL